MPTPDRAAVSLRGCRALVTGGVGFIGSHIVDELVRAGAGEILVLDNFVRGDRANVTWALANGRVKVVAGDIRNLPLVNTLMSGIDVVFHQAAIRITQYAEEPRLARLMLAAMDSPLVPEHAPARTVNPVPRRLADVGEAQRQIGFTSSIALPDGLRRLVAWWQEEQCAKTYAKTR